MPREIERKFSQPKFLMRFENKITAKTTRTFYHVIKIKSYINKGCMLGPGCAYLLL